LFHEEWILDGGRQKISENNSVELYNLKEDIGERNNLCDSEPEIRNDLIDDLLQWLDETGAMIPSDANPQYIPK